MIAITNREIYSDNGKFVHRLGADIYFSRSTKLPGDDPSKFEEVDSIPEVPTTEQTYDEQVNNLIRERYSASQEFSILRQKETKPQEYDEYFRYCEECKQRAKQ